MPKFTTDQVLAVLTPAGWPMTTAAVKEACREKLDLDRYGGSTGDARAALEALVGQGLVVKARRNQRIERGAAANPYRFIAQPGYGNEWFWMTKANADAYKVALAAREAADTALQARGKRLAELLGIRERDVDTQAYLGGQTAVGLKASAEHLERIIAALEAAQARA